jgi:hypothetical protein
MTGDDVGEAIVRQCRQLARGIRVEHLHTRRGERQQVHVHAVLIHVTQPRVLDVQQSLEEIQLPITRLRIVDA